jgi:hypothetical protein
MTISVVIPAYQASGYIDAALASVVAQTLPPDEVIVVDDGSTDATAATVERWRPLLPLRVVQLERNLGRGLGAGGARAAGIERSTGHLVALLDADDVWLPDHLTTMRDEHERHGGLVTANYYLWVPGAALGDRPASQLVPVPTERQLPRLLEENFVFVSTLFSRALYDRAGGFRNIRCEDWDLWIRMVRCGATVSMPSHVTALYRRSPGSVSSIDKLLIGDIDLLEELLTTADGDERDAIVRGLRRRRAKQAFLDGVQHAEAGDVGAARAAWLRSLVLDVGLGSANSRLNGRVAVRAAASIVAPKRMMRVRRGRQQDPGFAVGGPTLAGPR